MKRILLTAAASFAAFALTAPASASGARPDPQEVSVHYGDLDLAKPAGAEAMLNRLERAAERACGGEPDLRALYAQRLFNRCVDDALNQAVARLDAPLVTSLHADRGGQRLARNAQ